MTLFEVVGLVGAVVASATLVERIHARLTQPPKGHGVTDLERRADISEAGIEALRRDVGHERERAQDRHEKLMDIISEIRGDVARARRRGGVDP